MRVAAIDRFTALSIILSLMIGLANCDVLPCNSSNLVTFPVNDTIKEGTVLRELHKNFSIDESKSCESMDVVNGSLILTTSLRGELCDEEFRTCSLKCLTNGVDVIISITRIRLYPFTFPQAVFQTSVQEGSPTGTSVFYFDKNGSRPTSEDCIKGINYGLSETTPGPFSILGNPGYVTTNGPLDYDTQQEYTLTVTATADISNTTNTTTLVIRIKDVDDKPPAFTAPRYVLHVPEETISIDALTSEPRLFCRDLDVGLNTTVVYDITETDSFVTVVNDTGVLTQTRPFDRETMPEWETNIICYQEDDDTKSDVAILHVYVTDVNDNAAVFDSTSREISLIENSFSGTYVTSVTATDKDLGDNAVIIYRIDQLSDTFNIDNTTGIITVKDSGLLDREQRSNLTVVVYAMDKEGNRSSNNVTIVVTLIDVNDNTPIFSEADYRFFFNTSDNGTIIGKVTALDDDAPDTPNSNTTYRIYQAMQTPGGGGQFPLYLDTLTGNLSINGPVLPNTSYSMILEACDNPLDTRERRCSIARVVAAYTQNTSYTTISVTMEIVENSLIGTMIGQLPLYGDDYDIVSEDFEVDIPSHMLITTRELDRETVDVYNISVNVISDTLGPRGVINITVRVTDMNDNPPVFGESEYFFTIPRSQTGDNIIGAVLATDADTGNNSNLVYTFQQNSLSDVFDLDPKTGIITIKDTWWTTIPRSFYQLPVTVSDLGTPSLQTSAIVYISEMSSDENTRSIELGTLAVSSLIIGNKTYFESEIAKVLEIERIQIASVKDAQLPQEHMRSYVNITGFNINNTAIPVPDLQRLVIENWAPIQDLFREPVQYMRTGEESTSVGLNTAEIALIVMAGVILIGGIIAIVVICKMWNSHLKNQRLYENLRRPSTLYDDQELRLDFGDERGTGHFRSRHKPDPQELEGSFGLGYINTAYAAEEDDAGSAPKTPTWSVNDTPRIPRWSTTNSLKDAMESLQELTNRLNSEDSISRVTSLSRECRSIRSFKSGAGETPLIDDVQEKHKAFDDTDDYITPIVDYPIDPKDTETLVADVNEEEDGIDETGSKTTSGISYVSSFRKQCGEADDDTDDKAVIVEATAF